MKRKQWLGIEREMSQNIKQPRVTLWKLQSLVQVEQTLLCAVMKCQESDDVTPSSHLVSHISGTLGHFSDIS